MIDERELFRSTWDDEPPTRLDLDEMIRVSRRRLRWRRSAGVAGGAAALTTVGALVASLSPGATGGDAPAATGPSDRVAATMSRLDAAIPAEIERLAPTVRWTRPWEAPRWTDEVVWQSSMTDGPVFVGQALINVDGRVGGLLLNVQHLGALAFLPCGPPEPGITCEVTTARDGAVVRTVVTGVPDGKTWREITVAVDRADQTSVWLTCDNKSGWRENEGATGGAPPLSAEQLVELALDPDLAFT